MAPKDSEATQASLWDRLMDDLPGLTSELVALKRTLIESVGEDVAQDIMASDERDLLRRDDLTRQEFMLARSLIRKSEERARIEAQGVVVSIDALREAVRRDIETLFNIERLEADYELTESEEEWIVSPSELLADFPLVRESVVNYGVPAFVGHRGRDRDTDALARELERILGVYEPRLARDSIKVRIDYSDRSGMRVDVDAILVAPEPERLHLSTTINLENGHAATSVEVS